MSQIKIQSLHSRERRILNPKYIKKKMFSIVEHKPQNWHQAITSNTKYGELQEIDNQEGTIDEKEDL